MKCEDKAKDLCDKKSTFSFRSYDLCHQKQMDKHHFDPFNYLSLRFQALIGKAVPGTNVARQASAYPKLM